ncbi:MAG TPA: Pycsar system effector family protein, partial [Segetibacter sp.]
KEIRKLIRKEIEAVNKIKINREEWIAESIAIMEGHQYHTDYCKSALNKTKEENLNNLKNKQIAKSLEKGSPVFPDGSPAGLDNEHDDFVATVTASKQQKKPTRGIETMFRISSANSQKISSMADNKAHIMISVNSIIISVVVGLLVGRLNENRNLIIPTIILLIVNVTTIIYSILATRPKVHKGFFTNEQVERKSVNLLFYGSFYNMDLKEFDSGMRQMMNDREFLYGSLIKDIYWQ